MRLILEENCLKSCIMLGKAFCGNGFIHLNIAEIHEEDIGGPENMRSDCRSGHKMNESGERPIN